MHECQALNQKPLVEKRKLNSHNSAGFCFACMVSLWKAVVCYLSNRNSPGNPLCGRTHNCSESPDSRCGGLRISIVIEQRLTPSHHCIHCNVAWVFFFFFLHDHEANLLGLLRLVRGLQVCNEVCISLTFNCLYLCALLVWREELKV